MAFATGSITFRRFLIAGPAPADVTDAFIQAVNDHAFGRYASPGADGTEIGWISGRHLFDTQILAERIAFGRFVHLAMRVDRNAVPAGVLRGYTQIEEDAALAATGRDYLSKAEKQRARNAAQERVEREIKNGAFRRMAAYPVLIDLDRQVVYLGCLASAVGEKMAALFLDTFGCAVEAAEAGRVAYRIMESARDPRSVEDARPFHLTPPPEHHDDGDVFPPGDASFLGREFLTWLWWRTESDDSALRLSTGDDVAVMIDRLMRLDCDFGRNGTTTITADAPAHLPEARAALAGGKQPTRMGLIFGSRAGEFNLTLEGPRMAVSGLTLPQDQEKRTAAETLEHRFEQIADVAELVNVLYEVFLRRRTAADWPRDLGAMRAWAVNAGAKSPFLAASA